MPENAQGRGLRIAAVFAQQILDSRGYPTIRVSLVLPDGHTVTADAPAGASTGTHEALELRDGGRFFSGRAFAHEASLPLYSRLAAESGSAPRLPVPHFNVLNGGTHAANALAARVRQGFGTTGLDDEGGLTEDDEDGWPAQFEVLADRVQLVGDDLSVTEPARIADLAVGTGVGQFKSGAPARGERVAKYNRVAEIAREQRGLPYGLGSSVVRERSA